MPLAQGIQTDEHHRSDRTCIHWFAKGRGVGTDEIDLESSKVFRRYSFANEGAKPGVDAVNRFSRRNNSVNHGACCVDVGPSTVGHRHGRFSLCNGQDLLERKCRAVDDDHGIGHGWSPPKYCCNRLSSTIWGKVIFRFDSSSMARILADRAPELRAHALRATPLLTSQ